MNESSTILQRIAQGSQAAVKECLTRHGGLVWSLARRWSADHAEAEDLAQEIFLDLWVNAARFDPSIASESTFIAMIARRRMIDRKRKAERRPQPLVLPEIASGPADAAFREVDCRDEAALARETLDKLRPEQRQVLKLSIDDGLTYDEIAGRIGMPLGTVKTNARRGLIALRDRLRASSSPSPREETVP